MQSFFRQSLFIAPLFLPLMLLSSSHAQTDFSANIVNHNADKSNVAVSLYVSKDKMRMDAPHESGPSGAAIVNLSNGTTDVLIPERKVYMEVLAAMGKQRGYLFFRPADVNDACGSWEKMLDRTGGTCKKVGHVTVNGRDTVEYEGKSPDGKVSHVWIDPKLAFPIKWDSEGGSGGLENIKEESQPASLFEIPAGYSKMSTGGATVSQ